MKPETARILRALFFVYVAVTFLHIAYVVNHEPFAFDAWNVAIDSDAKPATVSRFFDFWHKMYTSSNPRIGQPFAYLAYKVTGFAEVGTALAYLAIVLAGFMLGTGRRPSLKDGRDLATLSIGLGFLWFAAPNFPAYMFCRAYATNYMWAAAAELWLLVGLRLIVPAAPKRSSALALAGFFVLGVVSGMGNEHVGPTLIVLVLGYGLWILRRYRTRPLLLWVGFAGLVTGYMLMFFAPGQSQRYEGLAERYTLVQQILVRGLRGNVDIYINLLEGIAPLLMMTLAIIAVGTIAERRAESDDVTVGRAEQRNALIILILALAAASLITATVFASPKLGARFYMHSGFIVLSAVLGLARAYLFRPGSYGLFIGVALLASIYAGLRTIPMYTRMSAASDTRLAELQAIPPGGKYTAKAWEQIAENWWALGDDMRDQKKQELVANYFGLQRVLFRGSDQWRTLGVTDVKLTMHYELDKPACLDEFDQLDLQPYVGRDIEALHHSFLDRITEIELVTGVQVRTIDLRAVFLGEQPPMPSRTVYVAKWDDGKLEGYTARLRRKGRAKQREIVLSDALKKEPWHIYMVLVGEPPKKLGVSTDNTMLTYTPWRSGPYWALACKPDRCFILLAVAHSI